jgi:aminoglycoside 6'-N-acetyltransferase
MTTEFRLLEAEDLPLLDEWLQREHISRWWTKYDTYDAVVEHYLPAIDGREPTDLYVMLVDERPIGFIQTYKVADHPDYRDLVQVGDDVAGVDLFIAEPELVGRGLGSEVLRQFVDEIVFADADVHACIADPDAENIASIRAFEKAGFSRLREFVDPSDGKTHTLVRRER